MKASVCVLVFVFTCAHAHGLRVNTTEGVVDGYKADDGDYYAFYGVPYAGPADGINRFKAPVPPLLYPGVFYANDSNIKCAQPSPSGLIGVENCLTLNILTNNVTTSKPVIVWLNAEDYTTSGIQIPSFRTFVEQNLTFVSLNFRLSIFGFLCLGIEEAPGNAGLRDVIQGLKWIKSNIHNFGGSSSNIVLMGHASGAAIVDLVTMAPQAKSLVHKAVALSGSGLAPWAVAYDPVGYAEILGAKLGYTSKSKEDLANHLRATEIAVLNSALVEFLHFKNNTPLFAPCIENVSLNPNDTVLEDAPIVLLHSGKYLQIPYIAAYTSREGTMRASEVVFGDWLNAVNENFIDFLPVDLALNANEAIDAANKITNYYFKEHQPRLTMNNIDDFLKYEGDTLVAMSVIKGAKDRGATSTAEVRLLVFGHTGTYNSDWIFKQIPLNGVQHGGILNYLFDYDLKSSDKYVMRSFMKQITTFVNTGTENSTDDIWLPIRNNDFFAFYYIPNNNIGRFMVETGDRLSDPRSAFTALWNDLYDKYYKPPRPVNYSDSKTNSTSIITSSFSIFSVFLISFFIL